MDIKVSEYILKENSIKDKKRYFVKWKNLPYK